MKKLVIKWLAPIILNRRIGLKGRLLLNFLRLFRPKSIKGLEIFLQGHLPGKRISIISIADDDPNLYRQLMWGDYWVRQELIRGLGGLGLTLTYVEPEVVIHLFGTPVKLVRKAYKIIWIYSHPERVNSRLLSQYDKIFCLSSSFAKEIAKMGFEVELMFGATAKRPLQREIDYDVVFVGNARWELPYGRDIIQALGWEIPYSLKVWGLGWEPRLSGKHIGGHYFENQRLSELYASSLITLNDHREDMNQWGFVSVRVFDVLASGGFCISDRNSGIQEIFGDSVPQYESPEHLRELISFYLTHPKERLELMEKGRQIALSHTWQERARQFLAAIEGGR